MINRIKGPVIHDNYNLRLPTIEETVLSNGLKVFEINTGSQDIIKIEIVFDAGRIFEKKRGSARVTVDTLVEGSSSRNSDDLAELYDFYGAVVRRSCDLNRTAVSLLCQNKHLDNVFGAWMEMVFEPRFDEKEIEKYCKRTSERLKIELAKNDITSYRILTAKIFGTNHPYGYNTLPSDILAVRSEDLRAFHMENYLTNQAFVVISGRYTESIRNLVLNGLNTYDRKKNRNTINFPPSDAALGLFREEGFNTKQVSLKMGCEMFSRKHTDFAGITFLNILLGGYFGSRLMKNIREDKGFTYGIYSAIDAMRYSGYFYISADVSPGNVNHTMREIEREFDKLCHTLVNPDEFRMVRNYILGQMLHIVDGPFALGNLVKNLLSKGVNISRFLRDVGVIKNLQAKDVMQLAQKYLHKEVMTTVLIG